MSGLKVRDRIIIILAAAILVFLAVFFFLFRVILLDSLVSLEEAHVREHVLRAGNAFNNRVNYLARLTADWGSWNDTYDFIVDLNEDYTRTNVVDSAFRELGLSFMVFIDSADTVVHSRCYDARSDRGGACPEELAVAVARYWAELFEGDPDRIASGVMRIPAGFFVAACHPVLQSDDTGPARGRLVMGILPDSRFIDEIGESLNLALALRGPDSPQVLSALVETGEGPLSPPPVMINEIDRNTVAGYHRLDDLRGEPVTYLEIVLPRHLYARGKKALFHYMLFSLGAGFVIIGLLYVLLDRFVVSRLAMVHENVRSISATDDLDGRIEVEGSDEIAGLAREINAMGLRLKKAHATLKAQEERLRQVSFTLLHAQELERKRISHELHDELAQNLSLLKMRLKHITRSLTGLTGAQEREIHNEISLVIDTLINDVRRLIKDLSPAVLEDLGLWAAIEWLGRRYRPFFAVSIDITDSARKSKFHASEAIAVFRIVQEALSNAVRHSHAGNVRIEAFSSAGCIVIRMEDDGDGFDMAGEDSSAVTDQGMGLSIMAQRAEMLGAQLDLQSVPGKGTGLTLKIPAGKKEAVPHE